MSQAEKLERSSQFRIKLLGTPVMTWQGGAFSLARKQARALIYVLGETLKPVSRDQLTFLFWSDTPEVAARRNLSRLLSYIRNVLPHPQLLQINNESIAMNPALTWSDVAHFRLLAQRESSTNQEAMAALYDGTFLSGFDISKNREFDSWLTIRQGQYEGQYLSTLKNLVHAKFLGGDYEAAIDYAQRCLAIDQMAEDIHQQLIQIYVASGDRGAAMRQFETCAIILERELGVEPLPETRAVYERVQSGEITLQPAHHAKPAWTVLPSLNLPLIGRDEAWVELEKTYQKFERGGLILISGEPGVGKSRLLQEYATSKDRLILSGNCHTSTQSLPYHPLTQTLRQASSLPQLWEGIPPIWLTETGRLLPELGEHFHNLPQLIDVEPDQAQARLYEALLRVILGLARNASLLICLDDLQWIDDATAGWLIYLANRLPGSGLCILATCRVEEKDAIRDLRDAFNRLNLLAEISLAGLSHEAIHDMLAELPDRPGQAEMLVERIANATGGNPFFVLETIRYLLVNDLLDKPPAKLPLAESVQSAIQRRLEKLSPVARQILEAAAVLSPDLGFKQLQLTAGRSELEAADGLDELVDHQLLTNGSQYRFNHDLIQQVTYQALNPWRRQLLHRRAGEALGNVYARNPELVAAQIAQHYDAAGAYELAVAPYELAATAAQNIYAHKDAISHLQRAIALASETNHEATVVTNLHEALADSFAFLGRYLKAYEVYQTALEHIPETKPILRANLLRKQASTLVPIQKHVEAINLYRTTIEYLQEHQMLDSVIWMQVWLDTHLGLMDALYFQALPEEILQVSEHVQREMDQYGTTSQRSQFLVIQDQAQMRQSRFCPTETNLEHRRVLLEHQIKTGNPAKIADAHFGYAFMLLWHGDFPEAHFHFSEGLTLAEKFAYGMRQVQCLTYLMILHRLQGQTSLVQELWPSTHKVAKEVGFPMYIAVSLANRAWLNYRKSQWDAAKLDAHAALESWGSSPYPFKWLAYWVLLAVALHENQVSVAVQAVNEMLEPVQQFLSDEVMTALERASERWKDQDGVTARLFLEQAVKLAQERGYL